MVAKKKLSKKVVQPKASKLQVTKKVSKNIFVALKDRLSAYLSRRPHRSFRRTRRRDYVRSLQLPGYIAFTNHVRQTLWKNRKIFTLLIVAYAALTIAMVGITSQESYATLVETIKSTSADAFAGFFGELGRAGLLLASATTGGLADSLTDTQQVYAGIIILLTWLTSVWLLRNILAGHKVKLRDGLYNASSPILSTVLVALVLLIQMLPVALAFIGYSAATATGLLDGGVEAMLFWFAAGLLCLTSLYFATSTIFALIIVTLPGMYPLRAIKIAGDLITGRRIRILLRFIWMLALTILLWALIMIPVIIFDGWIKGVWSEISWLPIVPLFILLLSAITAVWVSTYVYLLYRKVVADESASA